MKRKKSTAAKSAAKRLPFTEFILKLHKNPALVKRYFKHPAAVVKSAGLTPAQVAVLKTGSWAKIAAHMAKESQIVGAIRIGPLLSPIEYLFWVWE
jgi:ABC-type protease/lipase transport system fused ATPase/permease subunit